MSSTCQLAPKNGVNDAVHQSSLDTRHGLPPNAPPRSPAYMPIYLQSPQGQTGDKSIGLAVMGNARRICHTGFLLTSLLRFAPNVTLVIRSAKLSTVGI